MGRRRLLCEQRGAITVLAGLSLVFVIASAAMTVDVGKLAWQKRSLQRLVDVVSLDTVRALGDRKDAVTDAGVVALQFAQASATRNSFAYADAANNNSLTVELGIADAATKVFTSVTQSDYGLANAVRVTATHRVDTHFIPGSSVLTAQAVAMVDPLATFGIGSYLARVDTTTSPILNSVVGGMLGGGVSLTAVGYNGLADASVTLGAVWAQLGLLTTDQILNSQVTVRQLLDATAVALNNQGDPTSLAAATTLGTLAAQINQSVHFNFGQMLALATGDPGNAANARVNVLQMIGAAAEVANGNSALNVSVPITIPGVATVSMKMGLIQKPVYASGPARKDANGQWITRAHTAQARIQLTITLVQKLNLLLKQSTVTLPVYIEGAAATGELTNIQCAKPATNSTITVHAITQALAAQIGQATDQSLTGGAPNVLPGQIAFIAGLVNVTGTSTALMGGSTADLVVPLNQIRSTGSQSVALASQLTSNLALNVQVLGLGITVAGVTSQLNGIINPVLSGLDSTLLNPLRTALASLGVELGGADVMNLDTHCGGRRLIG